MQACNILTSVGFLLFNVSHWIFSHRYFSIAQQTPFKLANEEVPRRIVISEKISNWVLLALNSITPILYGVGVFGWTALEVKK